MGRIISISIPEPLLVRLDGVRGLRGYITRSEAVREAIRSLLDETPLDHDPAQDITLVLALILDKRFRKSDLITLQHRYAEVQTMLHTHIDEHNCLEIFVARGRMDALEPLISDARRVRGVKQIKFITVAGGV